VIRRALVVVLAVVAATACGGKSSSSMFTPTTEIDRCATAEACRVTRLIARQTAEYEQAGASHKDAACLANVTARIKPPTGKKTTYVLVPGGLTRKMDRCHIDEATMAKIGAWDRRHFGAAHP
jgi:hypothetical protein